MRLTLFLGILLMVLAVCKTASQRKKAIEGAYTFEHDVMYAEGGTHVVDSLHLKFISSDKLHFSFGTYFNYGHSCTMQGDAVKKGDIFEYAERFDDSTLCVLKIRIEGSQAILEDTGSICRTMYCGMRGGIQGATFHRVSEKKKSDSRSGNKKKKP